MADFVPIYELQPDDATIRAALERPEPPLLAALALATGDLGVLRPELMPDLSNLLDPEGGWTPEQRSAAGDLAFEVLQQLRDHPRPPPADVEHIRPIMETITGATFDDTMLQFLREELEVEGVDLRAPKWQKEATAPDLDFTVGVIGAGMSGLLAAYRLQQAGIPYVVFEKNGDVGGTWLENQYPGCRVDVANHFYSYSFAQRHDWPHMWSTQGVLLDYFRNFAETAGLRPHIRFGTEVRTATWSDDTATWTLDLDDESVAVQALIVAVGQLNRPKLPDIEGLDTFAGPWFHSARWDPTVDYRGKRVAVIGNGCSATQLIPEVAREAASVDIYQRTPNWLVPNPFYHSEVSAGQRWLFAHVPFYSQWYRFWIFYRGAEALLPATKVDPDWAGGTDAVGVANDMLRWALAEYLKFEFADRPDLLEKVMPDYPPAGKRMVLDNGIWARTLKSDNVELITEPIERIAPDGVVTEGGGLRPADIIVYGTGFTASDFFVPIQIFGRDGKELHAEWGGDARAYLGITIPSFPNLFCLYGPNTNIVVNGSIIFFSECEVRYILGCLRMMFEQEVEALEVDRQVFTDFNERVDAANLQSVWGVATVNSWYRNRLGRVSQNWPFTLLDYWSATRAPDPNDFSMTKAGSRVG